jgi:tetratricopeptide (TPR) repeat protein
MDAVSSCSSEDSSTVAWIMDGEEDCETDDAMPNAAVRLPPRIVAADLLGSSLVDEEVDCLVGDDDDKGLIEDDDKGLIEDDSLLDQDDDESAPGIVPTTHTPYLFVPDGDTNPNHDSADSDDDDSAAAHAARAAACLPLGDYATALREYEAACATHHRRPVTVRRCGQAAACWRNLGAVRRQLMHYDLAVAAWREAEAACALGGLEWMQQQQQQQQQGVLGGCAEVSVPPKQLQTDCICLDELWIDSLQSRAVLHFRHLQDIASAVECHEQAVQRLLTLGPGQQQQQECMVDGVIVRPLDQQKHTDLLIVSIDSLGALYKAAATAAGGDSQVTTTTTETLDSFHETLNMVRERYTQDQGNNNNKISTTRLLNSVATSLRTLSELYFQRGNVDRAVDALSSVMDIKLSQQQGCDDDDENTGGYMLQDPVAAVEAMEKMGQANEEMEQYDKALACYEKALLARSRYLGPDHLDVAKSLIHVARILELHMGNVEGGMDLYRAAQAIYAKQVTSQSFNFVEARDADAILKLIPGILEQGRFAEAVAYLNKCLEAADGNENGVVFDMSQIYYDLGRAYVGLDDYVPATICLVEAAKENGSVTEEEVVALLQHVEFLQRGGTVSSLHGSGGSHTSKSYVSEPHVSAYASTEDESRQQDQPRASLREKEEQSQVTVYTELRQLTNGANSSVEGRHTPKGSGTPVTWDGLSVSDSKSISKREDSDKTGTIESSDDEEATAFYDSGSEAGDSRIPQSDVSSNDADDDDDETESQYDVPAISIDAIPFEDDAERKRGHDSGRTSPQSRRRGIVFPEKFRRKRRDGFSSLGDEQEKPVLHADVLPSEEDFHSLATFDGPVQFIVVPSPSWDSGISQITVRFEDPVISQQDNQQEWWWGSTSKGFGRWFPSAYVSQAVKAAEGFLSAEAIHAKKKQAAASPSMFLLSEEDDDEEESTDDHGSIEDADHPSHIGIATSRATRALFLSVMQGKGERASIPKHDTVFSTPSPRQRTASGDFTPEITRCKDRVEKERNERGKTHPEVATCLFTLAVLYSRDQKVAAAVEAATEALQIQKDNGCSEAAIHSLHFMADLQLHQKSFKASLTYYGEALKMESSCFGYYSDETAKTLNCIGAVRSSQNEFELSMESHQEALVILKELYGDDPRHPLVLDTLCEIGSVYYFMRNSFSANKSKKDGYRSPFIEDGMLEVIGRAHEERGSYKMAISFFQEKLHSLENHGKHDEALEEMATTLNSLGMLCTRAGLYVEAMDYYEQALKLQLQLGCDDVDLATARVLTATVHFQLGSWPEALQLLEDSLSVLQRELGEEHATVAATLYQVGIVRAALCDRKMAMAALKRAIDLQTELLGDDHPATLRTNREIGKLYTLCEGEIDSALEIFNDVLESQRLVHGDKHPNIAETLHCIGAAYSKKGDYSNALRVLEECYYMRLDYLGWDHPVQATTLHEIANIHLARGRIKKASHVCDFVLRIRAESLTDRHVDVARTLSTKGTCLTAEGDFYGATRCFKAAQAMVEDIVGDSHPLVADIRIEVGVLYLRKCQFDEARHEIQQCLDIYNSQLDKDLPSIRKAEEKLEQVELHEMLCV